MKKIILSILLFTFALWYTGCSGSEVAFKSKYFEVKKLTDGVYTVITPEKDDDSNSAIIDLGDATVVIDTFLNIETAKDLKKAAEELTGREVTYIINTHDDDDHVMGNKVFSDKTSIIGTSQVRDSLKSAGMREPNIIFEDSKIIKGTKRSIKIKDFGFVHSGSDSIVYLPEDKIVFMGDLKYVLAQGSIATLETILHEIVKENGGSELKRVVWGHGPISTKDDIKLLISFLDWAKNIAKSTLENKGTKDQAMDTKLPDEFNWDKEVVKMSKSCISYYYAMMSKNYTK